MTRSSAFQAGLEPMKSHGSLHLDHARVHGPFSFLNPTQAHYLHNPTGKHRDFSSEKPTAGDASPEAGPQLGFRWTSRNNRKGRHALVVRAEDAADPNIDTPLPTTYWRRIVYTSVRMFTYYPVFDISWWVAYIFTWGSIVWVINAFFSLLPYVAPFTDFHNEVFVGGGVTAFIGATIFEIGSVMLMLEAINENRSSCFGWATRQVLEEHTHGSSVEHGRHRFSIRPDHEHCAHHHCNRKNLAGSSQPSARDPSSDRSWTWWPSIYDLRTRYLHDLGFIACSAQMFGASVFWISGFTALPGIINKFSQPALDGAYWFPQVLGGSGFIVSGTLFMIETQRKWWLPAPGVLGWHIGLWNLIGGIGFTLCPAFGFDTSHWAQYQASVSTFSGSFSFIIGSILQLYESLEKNPVEIGDV